ncbi:MAG: (2Fe-2S)-binding protein [Acidobacteria bacterium]|nr:(2Fe-2S)-binding protein [Acidobacteriota bacterium]
MFKFRVDGREITAQTGTSVAAAMLNAGIHTAAPLCGMGVCMQCRITVDGVAHVRSCQTQCREGMEVRTR